ncbi:hypothetical protein MchiMG62_08200 [Methanoculleus chikugoensis]|uniref:PemK-like protein n=1 Tax=Methanoculleus chikugoensis TaxID=118126 RepID=A0ABN5XGN4_9EURY|nr:hypothetical protein MchiMG62_08200 [Methanoculleus chikugoensis]
MGQYIRGDLQHEPDVPVMWVERADVKEIKCRVVLRHENLFTDTCLIVCISKGKIWDMRVFCSWKEQPGIRFPPQTGMGDSVDRILCKKLVQSVAG